MRLQDTTGADPNRLPYFLTDSAGNRVPVEFAPLTMADKPEIEGVDWLGSVFRETWIVYTAARGILKLVEAGVDTPVLGVVRPGIVLAGDVSLRQSLLETSPALRFRSGSLSPLRGVGRVLVARLIAESYNQGAGGAVTVDARTGTFAFYRHLGFLASLKGQNIHRLSVEQAQKLFMEATF